MRETPRWALPAPFTCVKRCRIVIVVLLVLEAHWWWQAVRKPVHRSESRSVSEVTGYLPGWAPVACCNLAPWPCGPQLWPPVAPSASLSAAPCSARSQSVNSQQRVTLCEVIRQRQVMLCKINCQWCASGCCVNSDAPCCHVNCQWQASGSVMCTVNASVTSTMTCDIVIWTVEDGLSAVTSTNNNSCPALSWKQDMLSHVMSQLGGGGGGEVAGTTV